MTQATNEEVQAALNILNTASKLGLLQVRGSAGWHQVNSDWPCCSYRIKPTPREVWIYDQDILSSKSPHQARAYSSPMTGHDRLDRIIRFREVIDE